MTTPYEPPSETNDKHEPQLTAGCTVSFFAAALLFFYLLGQFLMWIDS